MRARHAQSSRRTAQTLGLCLPSATAAERVAAACAGQTVNVGVDPSKVVITKLKIDKDRKARRRPGAALAQPEIAASADRQPLLRRAAVRRSCESFKKATFHRRSRFDRWLRLYSKRSGSLHSPRCG